MTDKNMIIIKDNREPLVDIRKACPDILIGGISKKILKKYGALVRKGVAEKLNKAQKNLPKGMRLIVDSAWRPAWYQKEIFEDFLKRLSKLHPKWNRKRILKEVNQYVAPWKGKYASGHMTGGAVDVRIVKNGRKIPMTIKKLSYPEASKTYSKKLPNYLKKNRQILIEAMRKAGFSNYPKEFWHWSYGDYWWAKRKGRKVAVYGSINLI